MAELIMDIDDEILEEVNKVCQDKGIIIDDSINIFLKISLIMASCLMRS